MDTPSPGPDRSAEELLDRYLAGEPIGIDAETAATLQRHPAVAQLRDPATYTTREAAAALATAQATPDSAWDALCRRLDATSVTADVPSAAIPRVTRRVTRAGATQSHAGIAMRRYGLAGGVAAIIVIALLFVRPWTSLVPTARPTSQTFATRAGQQATVTLRDGSVAVLGPATTLTVESGRRDGAIVASLSGQAQFTVVHDPKTVFAVRTGRSVTRVLGTTFVVRQYAADQDAHIAVIEGRVTVNRIGQEEQSGAVLSRHMLGIVTDSGPVVVTRQVAMQPYTGWTNGELVFEGTPVRDIVRDLARAYDADIRISDSSLSQRPITWNVRTKQAPLAEALNELATLLNAHVQVSGSRLTIVPGRKAAQRSLPIHSSALEPQYGK